MAVKFTEEQIKAIETLDKSILVSAAAGSGKTAVLVERILSIILEGKANVDEMLVVTFTKAAAAEMRLRLSKAIRSRMREHPEESRRLRDQLSRLYRAYISTIDSFALRVIREFFYQTDIEPDFSACDEIQGELMRREAVEELFEEGFADDHFLSEETGFREFLRLYSDDRSEEGFKEDLMKAYARLRTMPDYFTWAYDKAGSLKVTRDDFEGSVLWRCMLEDARETLGTALDAACRVRSLMCESGLEKLFEEKLAAECSIIADLYESVREGRLDEKVMAAIDGMKYASMRTKKEYAEAYEPIKEEVKYLRDCYKDGIAGWKSKYLLPDFDTRLAEMNETYRYTVYYLRLLEEFERIYAARKAERKVMDFADMEHNAVRILSNDEAAETMRRRFRFVFVDEYQDTNNIQEFLISKVSRPDNVFKVGDIKQSIYKFRQAEPEIFERLYGVYSDPDYNDGIAIDLSMNFRSNDATIRYINKVFAEVMEGYDERAMLYTGCKCREEYDFVPEVHILETEGQEDDTPQSSLEADAGPEADAPADDIDEEIEDLSKEEAEAAYIAELAANLIGTEFHDTRSNEIRRVQARDIVILFRAARKRGDIMARALRKRGVDAHLEETENYFDTIEIGIALSLLTCIDNMKRDVPLIATLHSEIFGWTPEDLAQVRIDHSEFIRRQRKAGVQTGRPRPAYWEALHWYVTDGPDQQLRAKAENAAGRILEWRKLSRMMALEDFVWYVLTDSGHYRMAGAMNGGARRQANLRTLADRAGKYSRETVSSLSSYITFLDVMKSRNISNGQASLGGSDDDVVRITTIHKSKGLEYPFVIVGGLGHRFREDTGGKKFSFDSSVGVSMPYIDPQRRFWRSTLMQRAITARSRREGYREELRILYVAMTRARNKLIMVGTYGSAAQLRKYIPHPKCYLEVIREVTATPYNERYVRPLEMQGQSQPCRGTVSWTDRIPEVLSPEELAIYGEIDRRFNYKYPDDDLLTAKAKYSVSAIRREELAREDTEYSLQDDAQTAVRETDQPAAEDDGPDTALITPDSEPVVLWSAAEARKKASSADIGIAYHRIMEFIDFAGAADTDGNVDEAYIEERANFLVENGAIEPDIFRNVDLSRISGFFRQDIGRRAAEAARAGTLRKEKPFTLKTVRDGREILVQGVIDCCFEEAGSMVLIDYKSNFIRPGRAHAAELERIRHEYRVQIELYAEAIAKGTGKPVCEAYLYLFSGGEALKMI